MESLLTHFNADNYLAKESKELVKHPHIDHVKYNRVSADETRVIVQAKLENSVTKVTRPNMVTTRRVDLYYKAEGPT